MQFSASQIAQIINGSIEGNKDISVDSFGKIEEAKAGQLAFLANPKYEEYLYTTSASIVIINESLVLKQQITSTVIRVQDAYTAFATLLDLYEQVQSQQLSGIQEPSYIHPSVLMEENVFVGSFVYISEAVKIGAGTKIYPNAFIGKNVSIGHNCTIHPGVKIYHNCIIGSNTVIHAGTVIGSDGFGFAPQKDGSYKKVPQIGNVVIEDHVEIGANSTIDRATIGSTFIRSGVKLDNLVQIAHNVEVGSHTVIAAQAGISGSTKIGRNVMIGGQAGIAGHLQIADGSKINGQSGVVKSIAKTNTSVTGYPANEFRAFLRSQAVVKNLPDLEKRIIELESLIKKLQKNT
jgi:UDP-3-O-[3-hydroxymyristoyl] glucosamine N-acyltransferase